MTYMPLYMDKAEKWIKEYPHKHYVSERHNLGDVWNWILHGNNGWRDKDFKWHDAVFYFKDHNDCLLFALRWP